MQLAWFKSGGPWAHPTRYDALSGWGQKMRAWWLVLFLLSCPWASAQVEDTEETYKTVAFVGRLISIRPLPDPCEAEHPGGDEICVSFDSLYLARYEVIELVAGHLSIREIDIEIADHYGFPEFARHPHALLFVAVGPNLPYLHKYMGFVVYRTTSNGWASCANPLERKPYNDRNQPTHEVFLESFGPEDRVEELADAGAFSVTDLVVDSRKSRCLNSEPLSKIYGKIRSGPMKARGIQLPAWGASAP